MTANLRDRPRPRGNALAGHFDGAGKPKRGYPSRMAAFEVSGTTGVYRCEFPGCGMFHRRTTEPKRLAKGRL